MAQIYLFVNAALYVIFALWCTFMPEKTASTLGLSFRSGSGKSEYITVYGGLEFGVAMFFLVAALRPELRTAGVLFAVLFYGGLIVWRLGTFIFVSGIGRVTYGFAAGELVLGILALVVWMKMRGGTTLVP